ncbi:saccharopine dehydrogenase NADP-binding domain-containing protein [Thermocatellispora tengchongensis]|uniref:saccharopine dehydrogenase NADP-binding domain-containing protein n=1 Tax=Thermocatellispora tengchongensis TaxID=1073253 RepID=UPI0036345A28
MTGRIVILGGYGAVGREAAGALSRWYPGEIVVAGRDPGKARPVTGAVPLRLDVRDQAAVERAVTGAHAVLMCAERDNARVARSCLDRGVHYLDVSASHRLLARIERLNGHARSRSVTALLSVHLAPGVTNLLARHCVTAPGDAEEVRIGVLLGGGERHGPAAIRWTLDGLGEPGTSWRMRFPEPYGVRAVHAFPFSDQHTCRRAWASRRSPPACAWTPRS